MGTEYLIAGDDKKDEPTLYIDEHSSLLDIRVSVPESDAGYLLMGQFAEWGNLDIVKDLEPEQLANIAFLMIEKCIYNGGDTDQFKKWLRIRLDETIAYGRNETKIEDVPVFDGETK